MKLSQKVIKTEIKNNIQKKDFSIYKNKFFLDLIEKNRIIASDSLKNKDGRDHLSQKEKFLVDTFQKVVTIVNKLEELDKCPIFINSFPYNFSHKKNFSRSDYVRYHLEAYYINIIGFYDRCLLLINHLYELGFQPKDVKYSLVITNTNLKGEPIIVIIKKLDSMLRGIKNIRNYIIHQYELEDKELNKISRYELLLRSSDFENEEKNLMKFSIRLELREYLNKKKKEIKENNQNLNNICCLIFNSLNSKYIDILDKK